ncbi:MAG: PDZ domain-containing protein [Thermoguttaceae bacterium]|nr:PDZ domain-containing protein [Thermoguttaceae bacterium]
MKKMLVLSAMFCLGAAFGASGLLQSVADEAKGGLEVLESSAIQLVDSKKEVAEAKEGKAEEKAEQKAEDAKEGDAPAEKTFWVGAMIGPIPEPILAQLAEGTIPEGKGACVMRVVPESPAEKAGLKTYDIILKVNGEAVDGDGFVEKVRASKGEKLTVEVLRAAKTQKVEVTPAERPAQPKFAPRRFPREMPMPPQGRQNFIPFEDLPEMDFDDENLPIPEQMREMLKQQREMLKQQQDMMKRGGFKFQMMPGAQNQQQQMKMEITPNGTAMTRTMTTNENGEELTISVKKIGDEPAKLLVEWKDESYETTEDNLDVIPEDIRGKVKDFLESGNTTIKIEGPLTKALEAPADEDGEKAEDAEGEKNVKEIQIKKEKVIDLK